MLALGRGGMQFMLIIWLQGIWLPLHGYSFSQTPLWAGIYLVPLTIGFLLSAPLSGVLSDRFGAKGFTTGGALLTALTFFVLLFLPVNFNYWQFALIIAFNGFGSGLFASPNRAEMMNAVPANQRGAAGGMIATFMNTSFVLSIGVFFSLMVAGLSSKLPGALSSGLTAQGVPTAAAQQISHLPPIGVLFAAFLGYNPMQQLLGPLLGHLSAAHAAYVTGRQFFPHLITAPFHSGLGVAFAFAIAASLIAAVASVLTGAPQAGGRGRAARCRAGRGGRGRRPRAQRDCRSGHHRRRAQRCRRSAPIRAEMAIHLRLPSPRGRSRAELPGPGARLGARVGRPARASSDHGGRTVSCR